MIDVSKETARISRKYRLSPEELAFADLMAIGWDSHDAYAVAIRTGAVTWTKEALTEEINRLLDSDGVKKRIEDITNRNAEKQEERIRNAIKNEKKDLLKKATSKEDMLITLMASREELVAGSPDWLKVNQQIIDVSRMKQDEIKTDDNTIKYFLPVAYPTSCHDCLYSRCGECRYYLKCRERKG